MTPRLRSWFFVHRIEPDTVCVVDCSGAPECGAVSVTNDADNVVAWLHQWGRLRNGDHLIFRDTEQRWDEIRHYGGVFKGFNLFRAETSEEAAKRARSLRDAWRKAMGVRPNTPLDELPGSVF